MTNNRALIFILIGLGLIMTVGGTKLYGQTIGLRSNNPGNIRFSKNNNWKGQIGQNERGFIIFDTMENGIRALSILLKNYISRTEQDTISKIISKYAPSNENDTNAYVSSVAKATGINPNSKINADQNTIEKLVNAIIKHENGINPIAANMISAEVKKAIV